MQTANPLLRPAVLLSVLLPLTACRGREPSRAETKRDVRARSSDRARPTGRTGTQAAHQGGIALTPKAVASLLAKLRNGPNPLVARVADIPPAPGLSNVSNRADFKGELGPKALALLEHRGFVVVPARPEDYKELHEVYEDNEYSRPHRLPAFVTPDALIHVYHQVFDQTLERVEAKALFPLLSDLTRALALGAQALRARNHTPRLAAPLARAHRFFQVAQVLSEGRTSSPDPAVAAELAKIQAHAERTKSPVLGSKLDYTMFQPRGHYTHNETLVRYFLVMSWYGLGELALDGPTATAESRLTALAITKLLRDTQVQGRPAEQVWRRIYEVTSAFVGPADDLTPIQVARAASTIWPAGTSLDKLTDPQRLEAFQRALARLPRPKIRHALLGQAPGERQARKFRFMGQRYILDSEILQGLVHPSVRERWFPEALDLPAAFGFRRGEELVLARLPETMKGAYRAALAKARLQVARLPEGIWRSNVYWSWLHTLAAALADFGSGWPRFMRSSAWRDRQLVTFVGSWTELRHDTILYAKPTVAEGGGDEDVPETPRGYVEPNVEFWRRVAVLATDTAAVLKRNQLADTVPNMLDLLGKIADWARFFEKVSRTELQGRDPSRKDDERIAEFGQSMAAIQAAIAESAATMGSRATPDLSFMALVADVHTSQASVLEEAVGAPAVIYVLVPRNGSLEIARGAIYTHYEFVQPARARLTDEAWRRRLRSKTPPPLPGWFSRLCPAK